MRLRQLIDLSLFGIAAMWACMAVSVVPSFLESTAEARWVSDAWCDTSYAPSPCPTSLGNCSCPAPPSVRPCKSAWFSSCLSFDCNGTLLPPAVGFCICGGGC